MIPKHIYQIYGNAIPLPSVIEQRIESLKERNPRWTHEVLTEEQVRDYIQKNAWSELLEQVNRIHPDYFIMVADIFRYLKIYNEGGVYLDIKSTITKSLDSVLLPSDQYILSKWNDPTNHPELDTEPYGEWQQWYLIAAPKHPYLKAVLDMSIDRMKNYNRQIDNVGKSAVIKLTGPLLYSFGINGIIDQHPRRIVKNDELGLTYTVFDNGWEHTTLFTKHYTTLTARLVI